MKHTQPDLAHPDSATNLFELAARAWQMHRKYAPSRCVVAPSCPVLYFGDRKAYLASPVRILTVALNPSLREFPEGDPWLRFRGGELLDPLTRPTDQAAYLAALDAYFEQEPYMGWFGPAFGEVLAGMDAGYRSSDRQPNRVLHTDLCSPLATDPTWKGLEREMGPDAFPRFQEEGKTLWHDLVEALRPDVLLVSLAEGYLRDLRFANGDGWPVWQELCNGRAQDPYLVRKTELRLTGGHRCLAVWGRGRNRPFAIRAAEKRALGRSIQAVL
ncbi:MAG: hypothetical protein ACNA8S_17315 [Deferrisomatales bacterium]